MSERINCKCCGERAPEYIGSKEGYRFWECPVCEFVFTDGVDYGEMAETYRQGYHDVSDGAPKKGWMKRPDFLDPAFEILGGESLDILDFGCGQSDIWLKLREEGHNAKGVDIIPPVRPNPHRIIGDILELRLPEKSFDLIYSFQVFEHIPDPVPVIDELLRILKPGGLILIHTDMETEDRNAGFLNWWYVLPPDHCSFYRHKTFEKMLEGTPHKIGYKSEKMVMIKKVKGPEKGINSIEAGGRSRVERVRE